VNQRLIPSNSGMDQLAECVTQPWALEGCSRFNTLWDCGLGCRIVHGAINSRVGMLLPKKLQSAVLEGLFAVGRAQVSPAFLSGFNPIASARVSEMQRILREGHSLQLEFPAEDLGFRFLPTILALCNDCFNFRNTA
jgi:hypothetical protein